MSNDGLGLGEYVKDFAPDDEEEQQPTADDEWRENLQAQVNEWRRSLRQRVFDRRRWDRMLRIAEKRELKAGRTRGARGENGREIDYNAVGINEAKKQIAQADWDIELLEISIAEAEAELNANDGDPA